MSMELFTIDCMTLAAGDGCNPASKKFFFMAVGIPGKPAAFPFRYDARRDPSGRLDPP